MGNGDAAPGVAVTGVAVTGVHSARVVQRGVEGLAAPAIGEAVCML